MTSQDGSDFLAYPRSDRTRPARVPAMLGLSMTRIVFLGKQICKICIANRGFSEWKLVDMMEDEVKRMMRLATENLALLFSKAGLTTLKRNLSRLFQPNLPLRGFVSWKLVRACGLAGSGALPSPSFLSRRHLIIFVNRKLKLNSLTRCEIGPLAEAGAGLGREEAAQTISSQLLVQEEGCMERYFPPLKTNCSRCKDKLRPLHMLSFAHSELHSLFQFGRGLWALMHACRPYFPRFSKVGWLEPVSHYFLISLLHSLPVRTDPTGSLPPIQ